MTFDELYPLWQGANALEVRRSTSALRQVMWRSVAPYIGSRSIEDFGRAEARMLDCRLGEHGLGEKSRRDRLAMVRQMLRYASAELGARVLSTHWELRRHGGAGGEPRRLQLYDEREMLRLVRAVKAETDGGDYGHLPVALAVLTGMRIGEVCGLRWADIDWRHSVATVRRNVTRLYDPATGRATLVVGEPKTRSGFRDVPLVPVLRRMLRGAAGRTPEPDAYVCGNRTEPAWPCTVRDKFGRLIRRLGLPRITFHGLRHTFATRLVEDQGDNGNLKAISVILGHSDVTTTMNLYVHPSAAAKARIVNRAFRRLGGGGAGS